VSDHWSFTDCSTIAITSCTFDGLITTSMGGAISAKSVSMVSIYRIMFSDCHSTREGGAIWCETPKFAMERTCIYNCSGGITSAFHAALICGPSSQDLANITLCGIALCTREEPKLDIALGLFSVNSSTLRDTNISMNSGWRYMVQSYPGYPCSYFLHCCMMFCEYGPLISGYNQTIERCVVVGNREGAGVHYLFDGRGGTVIKESELYGNDYSKLASSGWLLLNCCLFSNSFSTGSEFKCSGLIKFDTIDAELCFRRTSYFSSEFRLIRFTDILIRIFAF